MSWSAIKSISQPVPCPNWPRNKMLGPARFRAASRPDHFVRGLSNSIKLQDLLEGHALKNTIHRPSQQVSSRDRDGMIRFFREKNLVYSPRLILPKSNAGRSTKRDLQDVNFLYVALKALYLMSHESLRSDVIDVLEDLFVEQQQYALKEQPIAPVIVAHINDLYGFGVFAESDIATGQIIGEYTGLIVNQRQTQARMNNAYLARLSPGPINAHCNPNHNWTREGIDWLGKPLQKYYQIIMSWYFGVDPKKAGNETRFINHADSQVHINLKKGDTAVKAQNVEYKYAYYRESWHLLIRATRNILSGEELRADYGDNYFKKTSAGTEVFRLDGDEIKQVETFLE